MGINANVGAPLGTISGSITVRRADGSIKAVVPFSGQTHLTEAEVRQELFGSPKEQGNGNHTDHGST